MRGKFRMDGPVYEDRKKRVEKLRKEITRDIHKKIIDYFNKKNGVEWIII